MASEPPISNEPDGMPPDPEEPPRSVEEVVVRTLGMPRLTREDLEEMRGEDEPPVSDFQLMLDNLVSDVKRYSVILANISIVPETKRRIHEESRDAVERIPAWMDAAVNGPPLMTPRLFMHGLAQLLGSQRKDFEQVIAEQVSEPEPIEALLDNAPIPQAGENESDSELTEGVGQASSAHMQALVNIARDLDRQLRGQVDPR
jgi:hypothetical protein